MTFFATHPILAINPVKVAESLDVFTSSQSDFFFDKQKKKLIHWLYSVAVLV